MCFISQEGLYTIGNLLHLEIVMPWGGGATAARPAQLGKKSDSSAPTSQSPLDRPGGPCGSDCKFLKWNLPRPPFGSPSVRSHNVRIEGIPYSLLSGDGEEKRLCPEVLIKPCEPTKGWSIHR